jgi:hypothetical protein
MVKVKLVRDAITPSLLLKQQQLKQIPQLAVKEFVQLTPKRTGNARSHTELKSNTIVAAYPYAEKLDKGASKQAPKGMTAPLRLWLIKKFDQIIKRK